MGRGAVSTHACDYAEECMTVLTHMGRTSAEGPLHAFADINDRLGDKHRKALDQLTPDFEQLRKCKDVAVKDSSLGISIVASTTLPARCLKILIGWSCVQGFLRCDACPLLGVVVGWL